MRLRTRILTIAGGAAVAVIASSPTRAQSDGTITFVTHSDQGGKDATMIQYTKGQKFRMESGGPEPAEAAFIVDGGTGTTTILMIKDLKYMQFTKQDAQKFAANAKPYVDALPKSTETTPAPAATPVAPTKTDIHVTKTGTAMVAGVSCDVYLITGTDNNGKPVNGEVCAAKGVGFFLSNAMVGMGAMMGGAGGGAGMGANQARYASYSDILSDGKGIIKISSIENGKKVVAMEATKIDRTSPPDAMFEVPPGYTKFSMPSLSQLLNGTPGTTNPDGSTTGGTPGAAQGAANTAATGAGAAAADQAKAAAKKLLHFP
jgi:hypothetical protein